MSLSLPDGVVLRLDEPMARHSPWRLGGEAAAFVVVHRAAVLPAALTALRGEGWKLHIWGSGSRQIVRRGGLAGAVVQLGTDFRAVTIDGDEVVAGAAVPLPVLVSACLRAGLAGVDELAREPGTVGGLLASDALGAWAERVVAVDYLKRNAIKTGPLERARKGSNLMLGLRLKLEPSTPEKVRDRVRATIRGDRQSAPRAPFSWWSATDTAHPARLLQRLGLSGVRLRDVEIPRSAPGQFVNLGGGTVDDLSLLQKSVSERVKRDTGVVLGMRTQWLGQTRR